MPRPAPDLETLVQEVMASAKYRTLAPSLVRWVTERELAKGRSPAETVKAARAKLHQVVGAYLPSGPQGDRWLAQLAAAQGERDKLQAACRSILLQHASARERLPWLDTLYAALFADLPPQPVILDLACGLNPLAIPWMGLPEGARYLACDIDVALARFLTRAFPLLGVAGEGFVWNLLEGAPDRPAHMALLLKAIPCLEQLDAAVGPRLLASIQATLLLASFPLRSLGGRAKGMEQTYAARFEILADAGGWDAQRLPVQGELVFRCVRRGGISRE